MGIGFEININQQEKTRRMTALMMASSQ